MSITTPTLTLPLWRREIKEMAGTMIMARMKIRIDLSSQCSMSR